MMPSDQKHIYIYADKGASLESLKHTESMLKNLLSDIYSIKHIKASEVIEGTWTQNATLLIMPGGADLPYCRKLNGEGNRVIKDFVKNGGSYLGICAGAYYGSRFVEFSKNNASEITGERELAFFPGKAIGPLLAPYHHQDKRGARAAIINTPLDPTGEVPLYFNGGCFFEDATKDPATTVLGTYQDPAYPAILHIKYHKGSVILSGVHFEFDPFACDQKDPYLQNVLPLLQENNTQREAFTQTILEKFTLIDKNI